MDLTYLMAYEIGQERYEQLKRQASDDTRDGETYFYTGPKPRWDEACRKPEQEIADDFERLMTRNFNKYAGNEI